ncbi:hypothetical protein [Pseudomonas putida]|uniref:hypothetical protein n=1 Tax=Pseudomonas putida TaxID=303 RepID=UPI00275094F9|nr:hypothetical protein [Pseudomonas putida]MDP9524052.1 hypothetical protein [Pseudomonas putida]
MSNDATDHNQRFLEALQQLDLTEALSAVKHIDTHDVTWAFALQLAFAGDKSTSFQIHGNRTKRDKFYTALLQAPELAEHAEALTYANEVLEEIAKIERCFDQIRDSLPQCAISEHSKEIQFWSHIERASAQLKDLQASATLALEETLKHPITSIPEMMIIKGPEGQDVNVDAALSTIITSLTLTLKMLAHQHRWYVNEKVIGPERVVVTDEHTFKAGSVEMYAQSWNSLEDIAHRTLSFGGEIKTMEEAGVPEGAFPDSFYTKFTERLVFHREPSLEEKLDFLANRRMHAWLYNSTATLMLGTNLHKAVMREGEKIPRLSDYRFISIEEAITLTALLEYLSFDIISDKTLYHGLTMREWLRGYASLHLIIGLKAEETPLATYGLAELEQHFRDYDIPESRIPTLIDHLTFGRNSRDLYDSPLIRYQGDKFVVLTEAFKASNLPTVILSRLSSLETQFDQKGKGFEKKVVEFLKGCGHNCKTTDFSYEGAPYEYDALLLLDDTLFLIECKNRTLSGNHAVSARRYANFVGDTVEQIKRLEAGLNARPDVVQSLFGRKLADLTIVPVILNSLTYSSPALNGVYNTDYSAFSKFFKDKAITASAYQDGKRIEKKVLHQLWEGERPTAAEFVKYLSQPPQLTNLARHFTYNKYTHPTSEHSVFISGILDINEAAYQQSKVAEIDPA